MAKKKKKYINSFSIHCIFFKSRILLTYNYIYIRNFLCPFLACSLSCVIIVVSASLSDRLVAPCWWKVKSLTVTNTRSSPFTSHEKKLWPVGLSIGPVISILIDPKDEQQYILNVDIHLFVESFWNVVHRKSQNIKMWSWLT